MWSEPNSPRHGAEEEPKKRGKGRKGKKKKDDDEEEDVKPNSDDDVWRQYGSDEELDAPYLPPVRELPYYFATGVPDLDQRN